MHKTQKKTLLKRSLFLLIVSQCFTQKAIFLTKLRLEYPGLRGNKGSNNLFLALFEKSSVRRPQLPPSIPSAREEPSEVAAGSRVVVKTTGAPAVVVGAGQRAFKGLIKIRYPDNSTYHVELENLRLQRHLLTSDVLMTMFFGSLLLASWNPQLLWRILNPGVLRVVLGVARALRERKVSSSFNLSSLSLFVLVALFSWRLVPRRPAEYGPNPSSPVGNRPASRLVKRCRKVPQAVLAFSDFFGLACSEFPVNEHPRLVHLANLCYRQALRQTLTMFTLMFQNVTKSHFLVLGWSLTCYKHVCPHCRTSDKHTLYLVSPALFDLRVPELLRHSSCGLPFVQRCISNQDLRRWGCQLRPTQPAAPLLHAAGAQRWLELELRFWRKLLETGRLGMEDWKASEHIQALEFGAVILVDQMKNLFLIAALQSEGLEIFLDQSERQEKPLEKLLGNQHLVNSCV